MELIRLGISACLLGHEVRWDGGHKREQLLIDAFGSQVEWVSVCPEVEMGLGTPREPLHLVRSGGMIRMVTGLDESAPSKDHTGRMQDWARGRLDELAKEHLSGYVLKKSSPSCGLRDVKVHQPDGTMTQTGQGLFAEALLARFPGLPVEEEDRLRDPRARDAFLARARAYRPSHRLQPYRRVTVTRVGRGSEGSADDLAAAEEPLEVRLHGRPFAVIMRTPGADRELAAGFLLSESVVRTAADIGAVEHCRHPHHPEVHNVVDVYLLGQAAADLPAALEQRRNVLTSSSCGLCGRVTIDSLKQSAPPVDRAATVAREVIVELPSRLRARQAGFGETGGLHGAALFTSAGDLVVSAEDVGRHNAVDKVIGAMLLDEGPPRARDVLVVSGRASFEIVQKAWMAAVPVVCAVSAPSSLAVELAQEAGITLCGFVRDGGFNIYSHRHRISGL